MKRRFWGLVICVLAAFAATRVYWGSTFPYTHDGANHLARFANYAAALREGQFPPRFAPYIFSGFGFPVFHYNYPLANMLSVPFTVAGFNPESTFAVLATSFLALGAYFTYLSLRRYFFYLPSLVGTAFYLTSAYLAANVTFRGGIGELMAYALVPVSFIFIDSWQEKFDKKMWISSILSLAALLLSHNVLSLMGILLLGSWSGVWVLRTKKYIPWMAMWLSAVALTLWFWLPAIVELNLVALSGGTLTTEAVGHLLEWQQLFSPWRFGFSRTGPLDSFGFGFGPAMLIFLFFLPAFLLRSLLQKQLTTKNIAFIVAPVLLFLSLFLSLSLAKVLWEIIPGMSLFQFPWRWLFVTTMAAIPLFSWVFQTAPRWVRAILVVSLFWQISNFFALKPVDRFHYERDHYLLYPETTTTRNENRPITFTLDTLPQNNLRPIIQSGEAEAVVKSWLGSRREYEVSVRSDAVIVEPTAYFPGWEVKVDGKRVELDALRSSGGLVAYSLQSREVPYKIESGFFGRTPVRLLGEAVFLVAAAWLIYTVRKTE